MTNDLIEAIMNGDLVLARELFESGVSEIVSEKLDSMKLETAIAQFGSSDPVSKVSGATNRIALKRKSSEASRTRPKTNTEVQSKLDRMKQAWSSSLRAHLPNLMDDALTQMNMRYQMET